MFNRSNDHNNPINPAQRPITTSSTFHGSTSLLQPISSRATGPSLAVSALVVPRSTVQQKSHNYVPLPLYGDAFTSAAVYAEEAHVLRSFYQRWVLTSLRASAHVPEPLMAAR